MARSPGVPCQDSPLTCAGVSAGCLLCIVTTLCHEPRYLRICHTVSRGVTLPLVTVTAVSRHCAPLRSPRTTGRGRPAQPTFYCTPHMSHVYTCTPHMSHVHTVHVCESMRNISVASSYLRERKQAERHKCLSIYVRSVKYTYYPL